MIKLTDLWSAPTRATATAPQAYVPAVRDSMDLLASSRSAYRQQTLHVTDGAGASQSET